MSEKIKVFSSHDPKVIEKLTNEWLTENDVQIKNSVQTMEKGVIVLSVFYEALSETEIKMKKLAELELETMIEQFKPEISG